MKNVAAKLAAIAIAMTAFVQPLVAAPAAHAAPNTPQYFDRKAVLGRAATWTGKGVPYSQTSWRDSYRTDCSGFVSMAWGLDQSYVTWSLPEVARPISKEDLQPGDILLNYWKHVVIFGGWTNSKHTQYRVIEQVGGGIHRAVTRVIPYPYDSGSVNLYKPYRYTGGHNIYDPNNALTAPLIQTYAGGAPMAPGFAAGTNAQRAAVANKRAIDRLNKIHAQQRADAAAKAKAEAEARAKVEAERKAAEQRAAERTRARQVAAERRATPVAPKSETGNAAGAEQPAPVVVQLFHSVLAFIGG